MIISEKQIMQLIGFCHTFMTVCEVTELKRKEIIDDIMPCLPNVAMLLADITLQQSEELKVID